MIKISTKNRTQTACKFDLPNESFPELTLKEYICIMKQNLGLANRKAGEKEFERNGITERPN
jgi:hypothetical protein